MTVTIDCQGKLPRDINRALRAAIADGQREFRLTQPDARHNLAVAVLDKVSIEIDGSVGYYCGGMMAGASISVRGSAGWGAAESMMDGAMIIEGNAGSAVGASIRGGLIVVKGDAAARAGVSMKGGTLLIGGNCGPMAGFLAQKGRIIICGDVGDSVADSMYEGNVFVGGKISSLGHDTVVEEPTAAETKEIRALLTEHGLAEPPAFKKIVSGRKLWNFDTKELGVWKVAL